MCTKGSTWRLNSLHYPLKINDVENMEKEILKPFKYYTANCNNTIERKLLKTLGCWIKVPEDKMAKIEQIIDYVHAGSILFDDMEDESILRRDSPTANPVYGIPRTLFDFNWTFASVLNLLEDVDDIQVTRAIAKELPKLFAGQGLEIHWRENNTCPTEAEYLQMIYLKVSVAFSLIGKVMGCFSAGKQMNVEKLLTTFGIYYQIQDDYKNLCDEMYFDNKGFCDDLNKGKFRFPLVHAINNFPEKGEIIKDILKQGTYDVEIKERCISLLEECGSFRYTEIKLQQLKHSVFHELAKFDEYPPIQHFFKFAILAYF